MYNLEALPLTAWRDAAHPMCVQFLISDPFVLGSFTSEGISIEDSSKKVLNISGNHPRIGHDLLQSVRCC